MCAETWKQPLILASASPRRQELLRLLGVQFQTMPSLADEDASGSGTERVRTLAERKGAEVAARMPHRLVLAADTLVCVDGEVLGKPINVDDAARMLALLSGRAHEVHTGVCLITPDGRMQTEVCTTTVHFASIPPDTIRRYVLTGEPMDKAGAYAIQGRAGAFVTGIEGSPTNVIGLPLETVARMLGRLNIVIFGTDVESEWAL